MGAAADLPMGIIIAVIIYITTRELKEALTKVSEDEITRTSTTATTNMKIEHKSGYDQSKRGYRNNNPLNLRISNNAWKGKIPASQNTDGAFEQFQTMAKGLFVIGGNDGGLGDTCAVADYLGVTAWIVAVG